MSFTLKHYFDLIIRGMNTRFVSQNSICDITVDVKHKHHDVGKPVRAGQVSPLGGAATRFASAWSTVHTSGLLGRSIRDYMNLNQPVSLWMNRIKHLSSFQSILGKLVGGELQQFRCNSTGMLSLLLLVSSFTGEQWTPLMEEISSFELQTISFLLTTKLDTQQDLPCPRARGEQSRWVHH